MSSSILHQSVLTHRTAGIASQVQTVYTAFEDNFISDLRRVTTTPEAVGDGTIVSPKLYQFRMVSGSDVRISMDGGGTYPLRLSGVGDVTSLRVDLEGLREKTMFTCEADVAGSLGGTYVELREYGDTQIWAWFNTPGSSAPTPTTERLVEVPLAEDAAAEAVATALATALAADAAFLSASASGDEVLVTDIHVGTRSAASNGTTGWSTGVSEDQAGAASPSLYIKSVGVSQVLTTVAPG